MRRVHVVLPEDVHDPTRPSGGNVYDRRVCDELAARGWHVVELLAPGRWPDADADDRDRLGASLAALPDHAVVLVDGLIGSAVPEVLRPLSDRLRLVLLVHMPLETHAEDRTLRAVRAVVTTSEWTRTELSTRYDGPLSVAVPGTSPAQLTVPDPAGRRLLTVGPVARHKGSEVLSRALATIDDLDWCLVWVGSLDVDPDAARELGSGTVGGRVRLAGPRPNEAMPAAYAQADLLVLPSRAETYGMAVAEALACGIPVLASDVGGVTEALGTTSAGPPGRLVMAGAPDRLAAELREWLTEPELRERWRAAAALRRGSLPTWAGTADVVERALLEVAA